MVSISLGLGLGLKFANSRGETVPATTGPLLIDGDPVLVDTFEITFS